MRVLKLQLERLVIALILPFFVQAALVVLIKTLEGRSLFWTFAGLGSLALSCAAGFPFLSRVFRPRLAVTLLYFVTMMSVLFYFSLLLVSRVYGDSP